MRGAEVAECRGRIDRGESQRGARTVFRERRRPESLRISATYRDLLDRRDLESRLRREGAAEIRIMIVAARQIHVELFDDGNAEFEIARFHPAGAKGLRQP